MIKKILFTFTLILVIASFCISASCESYGFYNFVGLEEIPYGGSAEGYGYDEFVMYDEAGAAEANIPEGYSGYVLEISEKSSGAIGFPVDLSEYLAAEIKEIRFRIYCAPTTKAVRLTTNGGVSWHIDAPPSATEEWIDASFTNISSLADANGYIKPFRFGLRNASVCDFYMYVDHIKVIKDSQSYGYSDYMGLEEIPYGGNAEGYGYDEFMMYNEAGAEEANVPEGYTGYVLKLSQESSGSIGFPVDLSKYLANDVEEIKFRIYCESSAKSVRMTSNGGSSWHINSAPSATEEWIDVSFTNISALADANGYIKPFRFGIRNTSTCQCSMYIDSIEVITKEVLTDNKAPVINLASDNFYVPVGTKSRIDAKVEDDSGEVNVSYVWSDGAVDRSGRLLEGTHTLTITATDPSSNISIKEVVFYVSKYDITLTKESITINNAVENCSLIVACYNEYGSLIDVISIDNVVNNAKYNITDVPEQTKTIKAFVWDGLDIVLPLNIAEMVELG